MGELSHALEKIVGMNMNENSMVKDGAVELYGAPTRHKKYPTNPTLLLSFNNNNNNAQFSPRSRSRSVVIKKGGFTPRFTPHKSCEYEAKYAWANDLISNKRTTPIPTDQTIENEAKYDMDDDEEDEYEINEHQRKGSVIIHDKLDLIKLDINIESDITPKSDRSEIGMNGTRHSEEISLSSLTAKKSRGDSEVDPNEDAVDKLKNIQSLKINVGAEYIDLSPIQEQNDVDFDALKKGKSKKNKNKIQYTFHRHSGSEYFQRSPSKMIKKRTMSPNGPDLAMDPYSFLGTASEQSSSGIEHTENSNNDGMKRNDDDSGMESDGSHQSD